MTKEEIIEFCEMKAELEPENEDIYEAIIKALEQEPDTWSLEDAREDFMYDVYNTLDFLPTNDEANQIIDSFDRVTSSIRREPCEDCISREAVRRILANQRDELVKLHTVNPKDNPKADAMAYGINWSLNTLMELPSVTPKYTDEEIDRAQAVEQAYIDKMVELTVEETKRPKGKWIGEESLDGSIRYMCDNCKEFEYVDYYDFCPNCGARMTESEEKE